MTMFINTRSEGFLYWILLPIFIFLISVMSKKFKITHVIYWLLPLCIFYYIPNLSFTNTGEINVIMHAKIFTKVTLDMFEKFGNIYKNKLPYWEASFPGEISLIREYHANKITCMIVSIFAFWDSLLFDPNKIHFYNVINTLIVLIKHMRAEIYLLLLLILWKEFRSSDTMKKFTVLVVFPIIGFTILINFLQI